MNGIFVYAAPVISVEKIHELGQNYQGNIHKRFKAWGQLIDRLKNKPVWTKLKDVNDFFNQFAYQSDMEMRGVQDYWKSPEEFIVDGGGDCEDFAIIKYFTLMALGIPTEQLRMTYVTSLTLHEPHMVLSYYPNPEDEPFILDSLQSKIVRASERPDLRPVYGFNGDGLWVAKQKEQGSTNSLSKWSELIKRMH